MVINTVSFYCNDNAIHVITWCTLQGHHEALVLSVDKVCAGIRGNAHYHWLQTRQSEPELNKSNVSIGMPGSAFIKPDQLDPGIKDEIKITLLPTVTKFCVMWEGLSLPHDTKFGNCRCKIVDSRVFPIWSLIPGSSWSGLIKAEPGHRGAR